MLIRSPCQELALPTELIYDIISWVLVNSIHSICMTAGSRVVCKWDEDVMNILFDVSPSFKAITIEIVAMAFGVSRGTDEEEERLLASLQRIFVHLRLLGLRHRDHSEWGAIAFHTQWGVSPNYSESPYISAYALYISCVSLRRYAGRSDRGDYEIVQKEILSSLARSENLCKRVWPMNMTDLIRNNIQDEFQYARAGLVIVESFHEINECAESVLHSREIDSDDTGLVTAFRSSIHKSLSKFEAVCGGYSCHLSGNTPSLDPRIYELPGVLPALRKVYSLRFEEDEYNLGGRIQKLVDLWKDGCPFLHKVKRELERSRIM